MQTIDPRDLPTSFTISQARTADLGEHPRLLDGLLYVGLTVLFSPPGLGKSMLTGAVEEHLAYGRPFGPWIPDRPVRCLVVDLEGDMRLAAERSLTNTPFGLLPSDHGHQIPADIEYETAWEGTSLVERLARLEDRLTDADAAGCPYEYVRIDTLRLFMGAKPRGANAYDWDAHALRAMNALALRRNVCMVVIHHTNKAGEVSGSTGVSGSAVAVIHLKRNQDNEDECLLVSEKVRVDAPFRYALAMDARGRWEFTEDITPTQAQLTGTARSVVDVLTSRGPQAVADLQEHLDVRRNTLKAALRRLSHQGVVVYRRARWELTQRTVAEHPTCAICSQPMNVFLPDQKAHPMCTPDPDTPETLRTWLGDDQLGRAVPAQAAPPEQAEDHEEEEGPDEHPEAQKFPGFQQMTASITASRMKPMPRVPKAEREGLPWSLITQKMDGLHQIKAWSGPAPETDLVAVLDRNGSYPSAMSSVPVAPNKLTHTGPLGADPLLRKNRAGIFQIIPPVWEHGDRIPHPLGRALGTGTDPVWITSPHMELLDRLAREGTLPVVEVLDSWTGIRNTSLFERFYQWARTVREQTATADEETKVEAKRAISRAIRSLHPIKARSPWYRPDWHRSVQAEASVRHWATAWRAVQGGAKLLSIGMVDEVAFAVPDDIGIPAGLWVPAPYRLGAGYGQVKHKEVLVQGEKVKSPVTAGQWERRGRAKRER